MEYFSGCKINIHDVLEKSLKYFHVLQENTEDAWDDGDDDLIMMANFKMSLKDVKSTAMQVLYEKS